MEQGSNPASGFSHQTPQVCGQPEPHCSGKGDAGLMLTEPRLCWWLLASPTPADQCLSRAWAGGATHCSHVGKGRLPKAGCLKYQKVLPYSVPCCMGSLAAAGSLVTPAAASPGEQVVKGSTRLQLLAVSSSPSFITL